MVRAHISRGTPTHGYHLRRLSDSQSYLNISLSTYDFECGTKSQLDDRGSRAHYEEDWLTIVDLDLNQL